MEPAEAEEKYRLIPGFLSLLRNSGVLFSPQRRREKSCAEIYTETVQLVKLGENILDLTIDIHRQYGPGLLESCYHFALEQELRYRGLRVASQVPVDFSHRHFNKHRAFIIDLLVEDEVIIEIKSVDFLAGIHTAQLITYLKLTGKKLGYLINFNEVLVKNGFQRVVNNY